MEDDRNQFLKVRQESGKSMNDLIPALGWGVLKEQYHKFKLSLDYTGEPCLQTKQNDHHTTDSLCLVGCNHQGINNKYKAAF